MISAINGRVTSSDTDMHYFKASPSPLVLLIILISIPSSICMFFLIKLIIDNTDTGIMITMVIMVYHDMFG